MLVLEIAVDMILIMFVLAILPIFLGDLLLFASPGSSLIFLAVGLSLLVVLWIIDHLADESLWSNSARASDRSFRLSPGFGRR